MRWLVTGAGGMFGRDLVEEFRWAWVRSAFGYGPRHGLVLGLAATVAWYRDHRAWWGPLRRRVDEEHG
ncbi:hypothetical protein ACIBU0_00205 [Streptomyces sp. NPDC049627]|uniref:hypothetical protein n=1 Tax=Streptomyces sp. NPDC049627 TaxID=3365595 RepID=UPI0037AE5681